jgi:hypothetical protein
MRSQRLVDSTTCIECPTTHKREKGRSTPKESKPEPQEKMLKHKQRSTQKPQDPALSLVSLKLTRIQPITLLTPYIVYAKNMNQGIIIKPQRN